jgi:hypothetical protein
LAAVALAARSADVEVAVDGAETVEAEAQAEEVAEEPAEETSTLSDEVAESETETTVAQTAEEDADASSAESEEEVVDATAPPTTSTTEASGEEMVDELKLIEILGLGVGGGSGERVLHLGPLPEGLERIKVSVSGPDGYCNAYDYEWVGGETGGAITWLDSPALDCECSTDTIGVAWVHEDGRRSGIAYHRFCVVSLQPSELC